MELKRCPNGHFYDPNRYAECPYCMGTDSAVYHDEPGFGTVAINAAESDNVVSDNDDKTVYLDLEVSDQPAQKAKPDNSGFEGPVVGWVVAVEGIYKGANFPLKPARNYVGRSSEMDIRLMEDKSVSRDRHAVIIYEPNNNMFLVTPGDARGLFYLNGQPVLSPMPLKAYDQLTIGETEMLFVPFCGEKFNWKDGLNKASGQVASADPAE